jgi:hypothetical protein
VCLIRPEAAVEVFPEIVIRSGSGGFLVRRVTSDQAAQSNLTTPYISRSSLFLHPSSRLS